MGSSAFCVPSKAQPPRALPGLGLAQPDFDFLLWAQAGSTSNSAVSFCYMGDLAGVAGMRHSKPGSNPQGAVFFICLLIYNM